MSQLSSFDYLNSIVADRLNGDERRIGELFLDRSVFDHLVQIGRDSDWYHYSAKTFDGWYLIEQSQGFAAYFQERGSVTEQRVFASLQRAAEYFYFASGYVQS